MEEYGLYPVTTNRVSPLVKLPSGEYVTVGTYLTLLHTGKISGVVTVDGVTITGEGIDGDPLVAAGGGTTTTAVINSTTVLAEPTDILYVNVSGGALQIDLPAAPNDGSTITVVHVGGSFEQNPVTIALTDMSSLIDGGATLVLNDSNATTTLLYNAAANVWSSTSLRPSRLLYSVGAGQSVGELSSLVSSEPADYSTIQNSVDDGELRIRVSTDVNGGLDLTNVNVPTGGSHVIISVDPGVTWTIPNGSFINIESNVATLELRGGGTIDWTSNGNGTALFNVITGSVDIHVSDLTFTLSHSADNTTTGALIAEPTHPFFTMDNCELNITGAFPVDVNLFTWTVSGPLVRDVIIRGNDGSQDGVISGSRGNYRNLTIRDVFSTSANIINLPSGASTWIDGLIINCSVATEINLAGHVNNVQVVDFTCDINILSGGVVRNVSNINGEVFMNATCTLENSTVLRINVNAGAEATVNDVQIITIVLTDGDVTLYRCTLGNFLGVGTVKLVDCIITSSQTINISGCILENCTLMNIINATESVTVNRCTFLGDTTTRTFTSGKISNCKFYTSTGVIALNGNNQLEFHNNEIITTTSSAGAAAIGVDISGEGVSVKGCTFYREDAVATSPHNYLSIEGGFHSVINNVLRPYSGVIDGGIIEVSGALTDSIIKGNLCYTLGSSTNPCTRVVISDNSCESMLLASAFTACTITGNSAEDTITLNDGVEGPYTDVTITGNNADTLNMNGNFTDCSIIGNHRRTGTNTITSLGATNILEYDGSAVTNLQANTGDLSVTATAGSVNLDGGEAADDAVSLTASNAAGGITVQTGTGGLNLPKDTQTQLTDINTAVTSNSISGIITTVSATNPAGAAESFTVNNDRVKATSVVLVNTVAYSGTITSNGLPIAIVQNIQAGSFDITLLNAHHTQALNGTVAIAYTVL